MRFSLYAQNRLKATELFRGRAYKPRPNDKWTIGYGYTEGVKEGDAMTLAQADDKFLSILAPYEDATTAAVHNIASQHEFDAIADLAYNAGIGAMQTSTVVRAHNRGDKMAASRAFALFNKQKGEVIKELVRRRAENSATYLTPDADAGPPEPMPQSPDPESKMPASKINISSTVAAGSAIMVGATQTMGVVKDFKESLAGMGEWMVPGLCLVIVAAAGFTVWQRWLQRRGGWA